MRYRLCGLLALGLMRTAADGALPSPRAIEYARVGDAPARMMLYAPADGAPRPAPWLIRFSSAIEQPDGVALALHARGYALAYASYNVGSQTMVYPPGLQLPRMVQQGVRHLRAHAADYGLDPVRGGAWGWSRGGYAAALLAASAWSDRFQDGTDTGISARVVACIAIAGGFGYVVGDEAGQDLRTWPGGDEPTDADEASARLRQVSGWVSPLMPPTLLIRGGNDGDPRDALAFHDALRALGVPTELHIKPGAGHGVAGPDITRMIVAWADRYVRDADPALLTRPLDPVQAATALMRAKQIPAARQMIEDGGMRGADRERCERECDLVEGQMLTARVHRLMSNQTSRVAYLTDLRRLAELAGRQPALSSELAELSRRDAGRLALLTAAGASSQATGAVSATWPADVPAPPGDIARGCDAVGPWIELRGEAPGARPVSYRFRWCPAGEARLGGTADAWGATVYERPARLVRIGQGFWLGETEVTQAFYEAITGHNPSHFAGRPDHPVEKINFDRAQAFLERLNQRQPGVRVRLPLMDEWLWACRAGGCTSSHLCRG